MTELPLRVLLVEDDEDDALLLFRILEKEGYKLKADRVQTLEAMSSCLDSKTYDLVICDYKLPKCTGKDALLLYQTYNIDIPFILLSGAVGEELAVDMLKSGAHDYIMKDHIRRIGPAIKRELQDAEIRRQKKQAIDDLKAAKLRIEKSDNLKSTLLNNLSHEFRTPITAILGFSQVIEEDSSDPDIRLNATKIFNSGRRLLKTLDSIVWLAQLESGLTPKFNRMNLSQAVRTVISQQQDFASLKNLKVDFQCQEDQFVVTDRELVTYALHCLLDNALKYSRTGTIIIGCRILHQGLLSFAEISVTDQGIGIDPGNLDLIFDAFKQVSEGYSRHYEGIGLGLTNTRKILNLLGGTIKVTSTPGTGSTFTITFPSVITDTEQQSTPVPGITTDADPESQEAAARKSLLVVEDHESNAELINIYLRKEYNIDIAHNGLNAISMAQQKQYDLILMDINLGPGIDGIETLRQIRTISNYASTPVVAMTGYAQYGDKDKLLAHGCTEYISKPFDRLTITGIIKHLILQTK